MLHLVTGFYQQQGLNSIAIRPDADGVIRLTHSRIIPLLQAEASQFRWH